MKPSLRRAVVHLLAGVLLLGQLAISAHACQSSMMDGSPEAMAAAAATPAAAGAAIGDVAGADDTAASNLCSEHCKAGQQSDHAAALSVPPVLLTVRYFARRAPEEAAPPRRDGAALSARLATAPPHAILHCVRRT